MSDLKAKVAGVRFQPVVGANAPKPMIGWAYLIVGAIYPAIVIAIELALRICAQALFDPMPTVWHVLTVAFVPGMVFAVWARFEAASERELRWLALGTGVAAGIAVPYGLLFVPFIPLAIFAVIFYGLGLLPLAPIAAAVCVCALAWLMIVRRPLMRLKRAVFLGVALGLGAMVAVEVPMVATRYGVRLAADSDPIVRARGVALLRGIGDDDLLLRLCYGTMGRPAGPLGMMMIVGESGLFSRPERETLVTPTVAREIYYRVHGVAFNAVRAPASPGGARGMDEFAFDEDLGGAQVGGRIKGLSLTSSRIDGSIAGDDAVAYLEWTLEFANASAVDREARLELALPPGAVVSRATLWVNGEEREAAYGGRGEVRAAYQKVAVQQRRDPLLVTTKGADRVLAQAFPVLRNGGTIKFKLGISTPLELLNGTAGRLVLPAIFDRNFTIGADVRHAIWLDSKTALTTMGAGLAAQEVSATLHRISGFVDDAGLTRVRQAIGVARTADTGARVARLGEGEPVLQEVTTAAASSGALIVVVDGSAMVGGRTGEIARALAAIPAGTKAGVMIAAEPVVRIGVAPWSAERLAMAVAMLGAHKFVGGQDNTAGLSEALLAIEGEPDARMLWVHGPQPQAFASGTARLEQVASRIGGRAAALSMYAVAAGPNGVLPDVPWAWRGRLVPQVLGVERDLGAYLHGGFGVAVARRAAEEAEVAGATVKGSEHIARIWTRDRVLDMMQVAAGTPQREERRRAAVVLAAGARLITPVSGAVVLETQQQYDENKLAAVGQATVPTVPEPHEWVLIGIAGLVVIWLIGRPARRRIGGGPVL